MSPNAHVDHDVADHLCRWSRTGCDRACPGHYRMGRKACRQPASCINLVVALGLGTPIASVAPLNQCQPRRRSVSAAPCTTTKSP